MGPMQGQMVIDWSAEDFYKVSMEEWIAVHNENQVPVEEVTELAGGETKSNDETKGKTETPPAETGGKTETPPESGSSAPAGGEETPAADASTGGSGAVWWIVGVLAVLGLGGGGYWYKTRSPSKEEGGEADLYTRFIDEETTE